MCTKSLMSVSTFLLSRVFWWHARWEPFGLDVANSLPWLKVPSIGVKPHSTFFKDILHRYPCAVKFEIVENMIVYLLFYSDNLHTSILIWSWWIVDPQVQCSSTRYKCDKMSLYMVAESSTFLKVKLGQPCNSLMSPDGKVYLIQHI